MIEVRGPNVFKGYWRMPEKTAPNSATTASSSPAISARSTRNGYVHIVGRGKDLVISGGFNVYPKEIESEIDAMPGVIECAVIGVPHRGFRRGRHRRPGARKGATVDETAVI